MRYETNEIQLNIKTQSVCCALQKAITFDCRWENLSDNEFKASGDDYQYGVRVYENGAVVWGEKLFAERWWTSHHNPISIDINDSHLISKIMDVICFTSPTKHEITLYDKYVKAKTQHE